MTKIIRVLMLTFCGLIWGAAHAATEQIDAMIYGVDVEPNETINNPNGHTVTVGGLTHATIINANGDKSSQWCRGTTVSDGDSFIGGAGFCTIVSSEGDYLWIWWKPTTPEVNDWGVIGGSGRWAGATGGGDNTITTQFPDGRAWISHSTGTITTP